MNEKEITEEIENFVEEVKKFDEVLAIILFGSAVKGKMNKLSDIDIAIILDKETIKDTFGIEAEIYSKAPKDFDISFFHRLPLYIQKEVLKEGKILYCKDEGKFKELFKRVIIEYLDHMHLYKILKEGLKE